MGPACSPRSSPAARRCSRPIRRGCAGWRCRRSRIRDASIRILRQSPFEDGRGLRVDYSAAAPGGAPIRHFAECRFREPGRPRKSQDLVSIQTDRGPLGDYQLATLIRFWLATPEGRAADPQPLARADGLGRADAGDLRRPAGRQRAAAGGDLRLARGRLFARLRARRADQPRLRRTRRRRRLRRGLRRDLLFH